MKKVSHLWLRYATPRNRKFVYILLALIALAVASGAPGAGGGNPGGVGLGSTLFFP
jgi:hypothetical protein